MQPRAKTGYGPHGIYISPLGSYRMGGTYYSLEEFQIQTNLCFCCAFRASYFSTHSQFEFDTARQHFVFCSGLQKFQSFLDAFGNYRHKGQRNILSAMRRSAGLAVGQRIFDERNSNYLEELNPKETPCQLAQAIARRKYLDAPSIINPRARKTSARGIGVRSKIAAATKRAD